MGVPPDHQSGGIIQFVPTVERIVYGTGTVGRHLASEIERLKGERVFLLAPRSLKSHPELERISGIVGKRLADVFTPACEHVPLQAAIDAVAAAQRCDTDLVVAIGGGSVIDAAKALRTCLGAHLNTTRMLSAFMEQQGSVPAVLIPQISIPTTLSGAEYTRSFSATDFDAGVKRSYTASAVAGRVIIYDPAVTLATPMTLWLSSGVMAIDHAVEVLCAAPAHIVGDAMKLASLTALITYLPRTKRAPENLEARLHCQIGAWLADHSPMRTQSLGGPTPVLPSHALAYELAAMCRLPYALTAGLTLPACMRYGAGLDSVIAARQADVARALRLVEESTSDTQASNVLIARLESLIAELGLPCKFREVGISRQQLRSAARRFVERGASLVTGHSASEDQVISLLEMGL
jgi:alcohol dehydrogenase class IV